MNKNNIVIIGFVLVTLVVVILILVFGENKKKTMSEEVAPTATPTLFRENLTGGNFVTPTDLEYKRAIEQSNLKLKSPIDTGKYIIDYDWSAVTFTAKPKSSSSVQSDLSLWLDQNGYELVSMDIFKFIE